MASASQPIPTSPEASSPLFTRDFVLLCLVTLGFFSSFFFFFPTLPFYIKHLGGQEADVGLLIGISSLVSFSIKPLAGRWTDRYGRVFVMTVSIGLFACGAALHVWALSIGILLALRLLYGFALGCFTTASGAYLADVAPADRRAEATSYWGLVTSLGMGVVPPFALGLMDSPTFHPWEERLVGLLPGLSQKADWPDNFTLLFLTAASIAFLASGLSSCLCEVQTSAVSSQQRQTSTLCAGSPPAYVRPRLSVFDLYLVYHFPAAVRPDVWPRQRRLSVFELCRRSCRHSDAECPAW